MRSSQPRVVAVLPGLIPSTMISVVKPFTQLHSAGIVSAKICLEAFVTTRDLAGADLVVFCRNTEPKYSHCLNFVLSKRIPYIYDLDDNFFEITGNSDIALYHRSPARLALLKRYVAGANLVRVYSDELLVRIQEINPNVEKVTGPIDLRLIPETTNRPNHGRTRLVYATSRSGDDEFEDVYVPPLIRILGEYSGQIEMHFWGHQPQKLRGRDGVHYHSPIWDYDRFLHEFAKSAYDIGLAPMHDDTFSRSKSNNKFREYGGCGIAGVYSRVKVYTDCIEDGETGLLAANNPEEWHSAIVRLIEDEQLRKRIQRKSREYVQSHYSQRVFEKVWYDQIRRVLELDPHKTGFVELKREEEALVDNRPSLIHLLGFSAHFLEVAGSVRSRNFQAMLTALISYIRIRIRMR